MREENEDPKADAACRQLAKWRQEFWEAVRAGDRERAVRIQGAICDFPEVIGDELYDYPAVSDAWSDARSDTDLTLGFMRKGDTPAEVWEAKAEFERLVSEIHEAQRSSRSGALDAWQLSRLSELHQRVSEFFGGLTSEVRQHPVLRHAMSRSKYNLLTVSSTPLPTLSPEERAELKFRRIYRWTENLRSVLFMAEISPLSEAAEDDWLENELTTEQRIKEVVEARGGHLVSLYWVFEEEHVALLLTYGVEYEEDAADVTEGLATFGLFSVDRTRRLRTSEELRFTSAPLFPFSDSFREEDLDEDELSAFRAHRQREEERKRSILATTPCRICGRFVDPGERCNIDVVPRGAWLHDEDGTLVAEGPTALVYCSQHRS